MPASEGGLHVVELWREDLLDASLEVDAALKARPLLPPLLPLRVDLPLLGLLLSPPPPLPTLLCGAWP